MPNAIDKDWDRQDKLKAEWAKLWGSIRLLIYANVIWMFGVYPEWRIWNRWVSGAFHLPQVSFMVALAIVGLMGCLRGSKITKEDEETSNGDKFMWATAVVLSIWTTYGVLLIAAKVF